MSAQCNSLILSPHLDDGVLSCALRIIQERKSGRKVVVATLFTEDGTQNFQRKDEDSKALAILGAESVWLGLFDAPIRDRHYSGFRHIVLEDHRGPEDVLEEARNAVITLYHALQPDTVLVPLAIGNHIDHWLTHQTWQTLPSTAKILFYEDRPYTLLPGNLHVRLAQLGAAVRLDRADRRSVLSQFLSGMHKETFYRNVITNETERFLHLLRAARLLHVVPEDLRMNLKPEIISSNDDLEVKQIQEAISQYSSQLPTLYGDGINFLKDSTEYAATLVCLSNYAERYWRNSSLPFETQ